MEIRVKFLENMRLEARFDDFSLLTDQPVRYKGDGLAPSPFDYFLASSVMCAAYFVKVYCKARDIPTDDIQVYQDNIVDPNDRYQQIFNIKVELPQSMGAKHREGILKAIDRCTVKKVIQKSPVFEIETIETLAKQSGLSYKHGSGPENSTMVIGRENSLEATIISMDAVLKNLNIKIEIASWRNLVPNVWSVHIRDADSPMCFTNGKGSSQNSALCSALGEYMERISCNYFYNDYYLGEEIAKSDFVHYPDEKWFPIGDNDQIPDELLDELMLELYNLEGELRASHLADTCSGSTNRGVCAIPFVRHSDKKKVFIPVNLIGNLFVSNGMSAGNSLAEARVQCLSEILERGVKKKIIFDELVLPDIPQSILERYPGILAGIKELEAKGFPILAKDASLGGKYPVLCVALMNPNTGGVFASFGAHPKFEVALERSLTELLQGRSFEGLDEIIVPTFSQPAVRDPQNMVEHFIDSNGVISWKFFSTQFDFEFVDWNTPGSIAQEKSYLMNIFKCLKKEVYIAEYEHFGAKACRILVPGYSEIYPVEDLIWDNTNHAIQYREDILSIHRLPPQALEKLINRLEENQVDEYCRVSELIGIEFEENNPWGMLNVGELKALIHLALGNHQEASNAVRNFLAFNENTQARKLFFQAVETVLHISMSEGLELEDFLSNLGKIFSNEVLDNAVGSVNGKVKFYGLQKTSLQLEGLEKHGKLINSYQKIRKGRLD